MLASHDFWTLQQTRSLTVGIFLLAIVVVSPHHALAQGLLGKRYVEGGFQIETYDDGIVDDWIYGTSLTTNLPLSETWDFQAQITLGWLESDALVGSTPVSFEFDATALHVGIFKHFRPEAKLDPFLGIGMRYVKATSVASSPSVTFFNNDDHTGVNFAAGVEWKLSDRLAIRPQIISGDTLEDFDLEEVLTDNIYFESPTIFWWNENWFSTLTIAFDFDDSELGLRFTLGFGEW